MKNTETNWVICSNCQGRGKKSRRLRKKVRLSFQRALEAFEKSNNQGLPPIKPKAHLSICEDCAGSGLMQSDCAMVADTKKYPHVAIIGGGIGGVALAVALLHRAIPFTLYERDAGFDTRAQGYGLTLQQASKAIEGLGIFDLKEGVVSTKHVVHSTDGEILGQWGVRKWLQSDVKKTDKRTNVHIARQSLRMALLEQLGGEGQVSWGHQLIDFQELDEGGVNLNFLLDGKLKNAKADIVVGADGIRSTVRNLLIGEEQSPLRYLDCIVILGICPLADLDGFEHELLDGLTVFQTANGNERMYMMPYASDSVMWQLSFPMSLSDAKTLSVKGAQALKDEACCRTQWHDPIPQIVTATKTAMVSGYPVYDRELLQPELLGKSEHITLIGDAAHPMSPFKGQGANQALLDALALARNIKKGCNPLTNWREVGVRTSVLTEFETQMLERVASKVSGSAAAAKFLHSEVVLHKSDAPRGRNIQQEEQ
ncbi:MAG: FAD-dependent monooxygenase [Saccharospirillaceae bacterium]|nr:FAD-dependent monooxygenase [Pseudomonadales bacterium]NRB78665.1 FAD-dependent monooxygenase [Saccharospirillaceae bacterium]